MPQSLANILIHLIFSTKGREPFLRDDGIRDELKRYLSQCFSTLESPSLIVNGTENHIHSLFSLSRNMAVKTVVGDIKSDSSKWIKKLHPSLRRFAWQRGYGAFSVSPSNKEQVRTYILNQQQHHTRMTYQEEFRRICAYYGVAINEKYVWD